MKFEIWNNTRTVEVPDKKVANLKTLGHILQHRYLEYILSLVDITENSNLSDSELQSKVDELIDEEIQARIEIISFILKKEEYTRISR